MAILSRKPNPAQRRCISYLRGLVRTFGDLEGGVLPAETGRRMNSLLARLSEASDSLASLGAIGDPRMNSLLARLSEASDSLASLGPLETHTPLFHLVCMFLQARSMSPWIRTAPWTPVV